MIYLYHLKKKEVIKLTKRFLFPLSKDLHEELRKKAFDEKKSIAEIVREAIKAQLHRNKINKEQKK